MRRQWRRGRRADSDLSWGGDEEVAGGREGHSLATTEVPEACDGLGETEHRWELVVIAGFTGDEIELVEEGRQHFGVVHYHQGSVIVY